MRRRNGMVKILVLSDLHLERNVFVPDRDAVRKADAVVLAGDIHPGADGIVWARKTFVDKPVVYVAGNHEFYGGHWDGTLDELRSAGKANDVDFLEDDAATIAGVRFLGCTLWTDFAFHGFDGKAEVMRYAEQNFADYHAISNLPPECKLTAQACLKRHQASRVWLEAELPKGNPSHTVVVTHHYAHARSTAPKYTNDALTAVFGSKLPESLLLQAGLWIHGHAHSSFDYRIDGHIGGTNRYVRVVCNPCGYPRTEMYNYIENPSFNPGLLITQLPDGNWGEHHEL
ncbi:MAG: metallophosphoesterase [Rhodoferax sp.]